MQYLTINQTAVRTGVTANHLRSMQRQGKLPGFFSGNRFYVNLDMLDAYLKAECERNGGMTNHEAQ